MPAIDDEVAGSDHTDKTTSDSAEESRGDAAVSRWPDLTTLKALWIQAAALLVILFAILAIVDNGHIAVPDEGVYLAQAENLTNGSWSRERSAIDVDPDGYFTPVTDNGVVGDRVTAYYKHPLYPVVLAPAFAIGGTTGTLALSVLGTWGAALTAAFLARRLKPGYGPWTLWIVGVGSPLLFDAFITVAHGLAAAFAGLALLGLSRALDDRRYLNMLYALPSVALMVAIRGEGAIVAAAIGGVIGLTSLGLPPFRHVDWRAAGVGLSTLLVGAATYVVDGAMALSIVESSAARAPLSRLSSEGSGPVDGAWASLIRPFDGSWANAEVYVPLVALGIILASVVLRIMPRRTLAPIALLLGSAAASVGIWFTPPGLVTGLLASFPVLVAGLLSLRLADLKTSLVMRSLGTSAIAAIIVIFTNYSVGGAAEWGGRFFHVLVPLLAPLVVLGLDRARSPLSRNERLIALTCLLVVTASMSGLAIRSQAYMRNYFEGSVETAVEQAHSAGVDLIVLSKLHPDGTGRQFWSSDLPDVLSSYDLRNLHLVLRSAAEADRNPVLIVTNISPRLFRSALAEPLDELGWSIRNTETAVDGNVILIVVGSDKD